MKLQGLGIYLHVCKKGAHPPYIPFLITRYLRQVLREFLHTYPPLLKDDMIRFGSQWSSVHQSDCMDGLFVDKKAD